MIMIEYMNEWMSESSYVKKKEIQICKESIQNVESAHYSTYRVEPPTNCSNNAFFTSS